MGGPPFSTYRKLLPPIPEGLARRPEITQEPTIQMKKTTSSILATAVTGLFLGSSFGCAGSPAAETATTQPASDKHACAELNSCQGKGGCETGDNGCAGKNSCKTKGGCATASHHTCAGKNECANQGGCGSGDNGCKGKNSCKEKGGCHVPIKH